jgi:hypothetical protein
MPKVEKPKKELSPMDKQNQLVRATRLPHGSLVTDLVAGSMLSSFLPCAV